MIRCSTALLSLAISICSARIAQADAPAGLALLPPESNTVMAVHVQQLLDSPKAKAENWRQKAEELFLSGAGAVPPHVESVLIGSLIRPAISQEVWAVTTFPSPQPAVVRLLAKLEGSATQSIEGHSAMRSVQDAYVVQVGEQIAIRRPAIRQETARWLRNTAASVELSALLQQELAVETQLLMAMDLRDMADPGRTAVFLRSVESLDKDVPKRLAVAKLIKSLRGVSLRCDVTNEIAFTVAIHFDDEVGKLGDEVKAVFLAVIDHLGASLPEFEAATLSVQEKSVMLSAAFSDDSFRRVLTLLMNPMGTAVQPDQQPSVEPTRVDRLKNSEKYLQAVNRAVDDLKRLSGRAQSYAKSAMWHENAARKIDQLRVFAVDRELLEYGAEVSKYLRGLAASLRGEGVKVDTQERSVTYQLHYQPAWGGFNIWGGVGYRPAAVNVDSNLRQVRERQAALVAAGADDRKQIWGFIDAERTSILAKMRARYGRTFGR